MQIAVTTFGRMLFWMLHTTPKDPQLVLHANCLYCVISTSD